MSNSWIEALKIARKQLGVKGFSPCKKGTKLYTLAKKIQNKNITINIKSSNKTLFK